MMLIALLAVSCLKPDQEWMNWAGFNYLPPGERSRTLVFPSPISETGPAVSPAPDVTTWKLKLFVLKRVDSVETLPDGTLVEEKCSLEKPDLDRISRACSQLKADVLRESRGKLEVQIDTSIDEGTLDLAGRSIGKAVSDYVYPRINGGQYQADDHIDRGPFASVVCVHPLPRDTGSQSLVNGTPVSSFSVYGFPNYEAEGQLARRLGGNLAEAISTRGSWSGLAHLGAHSTLKSVLQEVPDGKFEALLKGWDLSGPEINARLRLPQNSGPQDDPKPDLTDRSSNSLASLAEDSSRGQILVYQEKGEARNGGLAFPGLANGGPLIIISKTPTLSFWVKSSSRDPLELHFDSPEHKSADICLGEDLWGSADIYKASLDRDGSWHRIRLDLRTTGLNSISSIQLIPTPNSRTHPKITLGPIEYDFASFEATSDPADPPLAEALPSPTCVEGLARSKWAHSAKPSSELLSLLKDPEWGVRLNAIQPYIQQPDPTAEALLTDNAVHSIDGTVGSAACQALWKLGTPSAKDVLHQIIVTGVSEGTKAECARIFGRDSDVALAQELIPLQQSRALATRLATVDALGEMKGDGPAVIRMSFIYQADPELKLEVTRTCDPNDPYQWKKMLWSAVNEPSDAVRLESYEKLLQSNDLVGKAGGLAGVKDDSEEVRSQLLEFMESRPDEDCRSAIRTAISDSSPKVRASAINALSKLPKGVKMEELGDTVNEVHPLVQLALIKLSIVQHLALSPAILEAMRSSPSPDVVAAVRTMN